MGATDARVYPLEEWLVDVPRRHRYKKEEIPLVEKGPCVDDEDHDDQYTPTGKRAEAPGEPSLIQKEADAD